MNSDGFKMVGLLREGWKILVDEIEVDGTTTSSPRSTKTCAKLEGLLHEVAKD